MTLSILPSFSLSHEVIVSTASQRLFYAENNKEMLIQEFTSSAENLIK